LTADLVRPQDPFGLIAIAVLDEFNRRVEEGVEKKHMDLPYEQDLPAPFPFNYSGKP